MKHWSLTTLREKLIEIGAKLVRHAKYVRRQMAEVAVPCELFAAILGHAPPPFLSVADTATGRLVGADADASRKP